LAHFGLFPGQDSWHLNKIVFFIRSHGQNFGWGQRLLGLVGLKPETKINRCKFFFLICFQAGKLPDPVNNFFQLTG
jgi:hypothetical protein